MPIRSHRPEVRNPLLSLPALQALQRPPEMRDPLVHLLADLARDAGQRADDAWRRHKAPMAAYWKAVSVYARHAARAIRPSP
jgi:hypothetical protein